MSVIKVYISSSWKDNRDYDALNNIIESIKINLPVQSREVNFLSNPEHVKYDATKLPSSDIVIFHLNNNRFDANKSYLSKGLSREIEQAVRGNKKTFLAYKRADGNWCTYDMSITSRNIKGIAGTTAFLKKEIDKLLKERSMDKKLYFKDPTKHRYVCDNVGGMSLLGGLEVPDISVKGVEEGNLFVLRKKHFAESENTKHYPSKLIDDIFMLRGEVRSDWRISMKDLELCSTPPSNCLASYSSEPRISSVEEDMFAHFDAMVEKEEKPKSWRLKTFTELNKEGLIKLNGMPVGWISEMKPFMGKTIKSASNIDNLSTNPLYESSVINLQEEQDWGGSAIGQYWVFNRNEFTTEPLPKDITTDVPKPSVKEGDMLDMFDAMHEEGDTEYKKTRPIVVASPISALRFKTYAELEQEDRLNFDFEDDDLGLPELWEDEMKDCFGKKVTHQSNIEAITEAISCNYTEVDIVIERDWVIETDEWFAGEEVTIYTESFTSAPLEEHQIINPFMEGDMVAAFDKMSEVKESTEPMWKDFLDFSDKSDTMETTVARSFGSEVKSSTTSDEEYYWLYK